MLALKDQVIKAMENYDSSEKELQAITDLMEIIQHLYTPKNSESFSNLCIELSYSKNIKY